MPGLVGLVTNLPRAWAEPQLQRMVAALGHESFYRSGLWIDESLGLYLGWVARQGSFSDDMPVRNESGQRVLLFSGEEFPEPGTRQQLEQKGHQLGPQKSAYLVHLSEEDANFTSRLNGRFQGVLIDSANASATLFNDRFGMHRVYYHEAREAFYFAAEAKAILAVRRELRTVDDRSLGEFVACGCVLENRTLFSGIQVLPPASRWTFRNGALSEKGNYFQPSEWENSSPLDEESYYQELKQIFVRNLPRYFNGHEPLGVSLTGGLDTRMIMAWHQAPAGSIPCYTFGGMFHDCQDVQVARQVAQACQQPHQVIPLAEDFLEQFPRYAERAVYLTDGCVYVNRCADLYVNERAREIAPVRMTGNYGSEVLRWVPAFKPVDPPTGLFRTEFLPSVQAAKSTYASVLQCHPVSFAVFRQAPWHHYGLLGLEQTQLSLRTPYLDNDLVRTAFRSPAASSARNGPVNADVCLRLIGDGDSRLRNIRTDRGLGGNGGGLTSAVLRQYLEFTFKAEYAYDYGMPQWMAQVDHLFSPLHLERLFLGRHKFCHFRVWYRDRLASYLREMLLDSRSLSRPYLEGKALETMVQGHITGNRNYTTEIHTVLTLELLHRLFFDGN